MGQIEVLIDFGVPYVRLEDYRAMQARLEPAVARAEAAEAELAGLRERHENAMARLKALIEDVPLLFQRVVKAEARMFELEAAARWRPVSEPPVAAGEYLGWDGYRIQIVQYLPEYEGDAIDWPWWDRYDDEIEVTRWATLLDPPTEAPPQEMKS